MSHITHVIAGYILILTLSGCTDSGIDHALESDLSGVWTIEHLGSNPVTQIFTTTYYDVQIEDDGTNVKVVHCNKSKNKITDTHFIRGDHNLTNANGGQLHIVNGSILESFNIPGIVQIKKTRKSNFFNSGQIQIESDIFGAVNSTDGVCAQKIHISTAPSGSNTLVFSLPYYVQYIEIVTQFTKFLDGSFGNT